MYADSVFSHLWECCLVIYQLYLKKKEEEEENIVKKIVIKTRAQQNVHVLNPFRVQQLLKASTLFASVTAYLRIIHCVVKLLQHEE